MPARRRIDRRREPDPGLDEWFDYFESELIAGGDLADVPRGPDGYAPTDAAVAAAWRRLGAEFLADYGQRHPGEPLPWMVQQLEGTHAG